jgi:hypothetical protein
MLDGGQVTVIVDEVGGAVRDLLGIKHSHDI